MKPIIIAIDLAKDIFQVCIYNPNSGKVIKNRAVNRKKLFEVIAQQKPGIVAMEACSTAHYWGTRFRDELGHTVRLISPQHVAQMRQGAKNDSNDALAIAEAVLRPKMVFVELKTLEQLELQMLHRVRQMQDRERTALSNQIRGFLAEQGHYIAKSVKQFRIRVPEILEDGDNALSSRTRQLINQLYQRYLQLDSEFKETSKELEAVSQAQTSCKKLKAIRGVGPLGATALWSSLGTGRQFKNGRQAAANAGVVPRQFSSGGKTILGHITKKGDPYLRKLLVQGAQSVINSIGDRQDNYSCWVRQLVARVGRERAAVAIANKNVRIAWALLSRDEDYRPELTSIPAAA